VRLYIEWIAKYSDVHFKVISEIHGNLGITRHVIWQNTYGDSQREDSAEADLFRLIVHDLSVGHIARQHRPVDAYGNFQPKPRARRARRGTPTQYVSAFDNDKQYVLTELGKQFVHYTMNEIVDKITFDANDTDA